MKAPEVGGEHSWLEYLRHVARQRHEAQRVARASDERWRAAIRSGVAAGFRVEGIAEAAGVTRRRVYQIRDGKR